ncbi:MAG: CHASE2 domain-containing protein, partial [Waterburya sp.]
MNKDNQIFTYQVGGSLASNSPSYVERKADRELEKALKQGQFCYVLNSRQMGKSSLRVRAMSKLQAEGKVCIFVDLTGMGTQDLTIEKWYAGIVRSIVSGCQLKFNWRDWWREKRDLFSPVQRLGLFIEEVLLVEVRENIVIFIDEIDRVLSQAFSLDDFFALIHSCYQKRQVNSDYQRLTFTLLGVAAPRDLIRDKNQSPFELGKGINLQGFTSAEASPLMLGMLNKVAHPSEILSEILFWTGGQPFLTQKLCQLVVQEANKKNELAIDKIVEKYFLTDWEAQDEPEHLRTIHNRLCYRNSTKTIRLLGLYRDLQNKVIPIDNSPEQIELRLSGLVIESQGNLAVTNPIYAKVFNLAWIDAQLTQLRPYSQAIADWIATNNSDYLLRGIDLQTTLTWSLGKSLTDIDYQFLVASQDLAKQEAQEALAAVEAASKLLANVRKKAQQKANKQRLSKQWLVKIALGVTGLILLLRCTGILQTWEWNLLDRFFVWRLTNSIDPRIVVVTINEQDLNTIGQLPISDRILAQAIKNIKTHQPSAIALDLYRDLPVQPGNQYLNAIYNSTPNLYVVEKVIGDAIPPPVNVSQKQVGFSDQVLDSDGKIRRALLSTVGSDQQTRFSLGTQLALHYLQEQKIKLEPINNHRYRLGQAIFERFTPHSGGYIGADAKGYQILLNFWGTKANFKQYSLSKILKNEIATEDIRDRLIFIGSTAESLRDFFYTPYSQGWFRSPQKMPGVFIHANVTSQIINAAINNRPLLHTHNQFIESLWIFLWGIIGTTIAWRVQRTPLIIISICLTSIILIIACYGAFLLGCWLSLVPTLLTLIITITTSIIIRNKQRDRIKFQHTLKLLLIEYH